MSKAKTAAYPETQTLSHLLQEYQKMLREAERATKSILALDPQSEKFWDELSGSAHLFTAVGDRSATLWEEITRLIDKLPED